MQLELSRQIGCGSLELNRPAVIPHPSLKDSGKDGIMHRANPENYSALPIECSL
jgi:hypothetical protein